MLEQLAVRGLTTMSYSIDPRRLDPPRRPVHRRQRGGLRLPGCGRRHARRRGRPERDGGRPAPDHHATSRPGATASPDLLPPRAPPPPPHRPQTSDVYAFGNAPPPGTSITSKVAFRGMAADPASGGYWLTAEDGGYSPSPARPSTVRSPDSTSPRRPRWWRSPPPPTGVATGRPRPTAGCSPSGTPASSAPWGPGRSTPPVVGMTRTRGRPRVLGGGGRRRGLRLRRRRFLRVAWVASRSTSRSSVSPAPRTAGDTGRWPPTAACSPSATPVPGLDGRDGAQQPGGGHLHRPGHGRLLDGRRPTAACSASTHRSSAPGPAPRVRTATSASPPPPEEPDYLLAAQHDAS